jgi:hypothetical protein
MKLTHKAARLLVLASAIAALGACTPQGGTGGSGSTDTTTGETTTESGTGDTAAGSGTTDDGTTQGTTMGDDTGAQPTPTPGAQ